MTKNRQISLMVSEEHFNKIEEMGIGQSRLIRMALDKYFNDDPNTISQETKEIMRDIIRDVIKETIRDLIRDTIRDTIREEKSNGVVVSE